MSIHLWLEGPESQLGTPRTGDTSTVLPSGLRNPAAMHGSADVLYPVHGPGRAPGEPDFTASNESQTDALLVQGGGGNPTDRLTAPVQMQ